MLIPVIVVLLVAGWFAARRRIRREATQELAKLTDGE
jgi:hypothetical protein